WPVLCELFVFGRQRRIKRDPCPMRRRDGDDDGLGRDVATIRTDGQGAVGMPLDTAHDRVQYHALAEFFGHPQRNLLRASGKAVLLGAALDVEHAAESAPGL